MVACYEGVRLVKLEADVEQLGKTNKGSFTLAFLAAKVENQELYKVFGVLCVCVTA